MVEVSVYVYSHRDREEQQRGAVEACWAHNPENMRGGGVVKKQRERFFGDEAGRTECVNGVIEGRENDRTMFLNCGYNNDLGSFVFHQSFKQDQKGESLLGKAISGG
uniref:Uncharacterized protein n=1 Tax=Steinernema glaseri TaxID=37863 RepID=A0A1I8A121_9BILA